MKVLTPFLQRPFLFLFVSHYPSPTVQVPGARLYTQPRLKLTKGRLPVRVLKLAATTVWILAALCAINYVVVRLCASDMRWHVRQRSIIPRVVATSEFLMLPRVSCPRYLSIVVCSALSHFEERAAVRDTWGRDSAAKNVGVFFLVGKPEDKPSGRAIEESLKNESAHHGDIIQADFRDSYRNLTIKSMFLLKWAYMHCTRTHFYFKADDDMFVNVENLLQFIKTYGESPERPFLAGYVLQGQQAVRSAGSKWYLPRSVYAPDWLPTYIHGRGYVISRGAVRPLFQEGLLTPFLFIEDIFLTGIVAHKVGIELTNSQCFVPHALIWSCEYQSVISAHLSSIEQLRNAWRHAHNASIQCPPLVKYNGCRGVRDEKPGAFLRTLLT